MNNMASHLKEETINPSDTLNIRTIDAKHSMFQNDFEKQLNRLPDSIR